MTGERKNSLRDCAQAAFVHIFFMTFPGFQRSRLPRGKTARIRKTFMTPTAIPCEQEEAIVLLQAFYPLF
ncbi:hypothetical protein V529_05200 [Bacillus velezensis SQR9]|nr:hypothetical protein V529_05200 [Bacillus velezensis SQR9]